MANGYMNPSQGMISDEVLLHKRTMERAMSYQNDPHVAAGKLGPPVAPMESALAELTSALIDCDNVASMLREHLNPVLRPSSPTTADNAKLQRSDAQSDLVMKLGSLTAMARTVHSTLRDTRDRLDV